jgi:hypothetical protein
MYKFMLFILIFSVVLETFRRIGVNCLNIDSSNCSSASSCSFLLRGEIHSLSLLLLPALFVSLVGSFLVVPTVEGSTCNSQSFFHLESSAFVVFTTATSGQDFLISNS